MEKQLICSSCKKRITNSKGTAKFLCPKCAKQEIIRCIDCRKNAIKYKCSSCEFTGPN
ncbi:RNA-binding protein [Candidatus Woesearchaeota archaeon]|nr:RNA-binding protein [Candidatus Woesearchaeota archaeon]